MLQVPDAYDISFSQEHQLLQEKHHNNNHSIINNNHIIINNNNNNNSVVNTRLEVEDPLIRLANTMLAVGEEAHEIRHTQAVVDWTTTTPEVGRLEEEEEEEVAQMPMGEVLPVQIYFRRPVILLSFISRFALFFQSC